MTDHVLTQADAGQSLHLQPGDTLTLQLPQIGGTAFLWHIENEEQFEILEDRVEPAAGATGSGIGGGSMRILRLRPGPNPPRTLRLHRYRQWESPQEADASLEIDLGSSD